VVDVVMDDVLEGLVRHRNGTLYEIINTPDPGRRLEYCNEPYYEYAGLDGIRWIRRKTEMEDGRFKKE